MRKKKLMLMMTAGILSMSMMVAPSIHAIAGAAPDGQTNAKETAQAGNGAWSSLDYILVYKKNTPISNEMKRDIHKIAKWSRKMDKMVAGMIEHTHKQS